MIAIPSNGKYMFNFSHKDIGAMKKGDSGTTVFL